MSLEYLLYLCCLTTGMRVFQEIPDFRKFHLRNFTYSLIFMQYFANSYESTRHESSSGNSWFQEISFEKFYKFFNFCTVLRQFSKISGIFCHFRNFCHRALSCLMKKPHRPKNRFKKNRFEVFRCLKVWLRSKIEKFLASKGVK